MPICDGRDGKKKTYGYNDGLHVDDTTSRRGEPIDTDSGVQLERARTLPAPTPVTFPLTMDTFSLYPPLTPTPVVVNVIGAAHPLERFHALLSHDSTRF